MSRAASPGAVMAFAAPRRSFGPEDRALVERVMASGVRWSWQSLSVMTGFPVNDLRRRFDLSFALAHPAAGPARPASPPARRDQPAAPPAPAKPPKFRRGVREISRLQHAVLTALARAPALSREAADKIGVDVWAANAAMNRAARKGLVEKRQTKVMEADGRYRSRYIWTITDEGLAALVAAEGGA